MTCRSLLPLAVLNAAVRRGLPLGALAIPAPKPFVAKARPREFRPGIDPAEFDKFVDELATEAVIGNQRRIATETCFTILAPYYERIGA